MHLQIYSCWLHNVQQINPIKNNRQNQKVHLRWLLSGHSVDAYWSPVSYPISLYLYFSINMHKEQLYVCLFQKKYTPFHHPGPAHPRNTARICDWSKKTHNMEWNMLCVCIYIRQRNRKKNLKGKGRKNLFRYSSVLFGSLSFPDGCTITLWCGKAYNNSGIFTNFRDKL